MLKTPPGLEVPGSSDGIKETSEAGLESIFHLSWKVLECSVLVKVTETYVRILEKIPSQRRKR